MTDNTIRPRATHELLREAFRIPDYQRGYRWNKQQVVELLEDVLAFQANEENRQQDRFYCLQPIVVKECPPGAEWEVVDGQQRLTTLFLILQYLNQRLTEKFRKKLFRLTYATRPGSEEYLTTLDKDKATNNIDYHFLFLANATIEQWFADKQHLTGGFEDALLNRVKVIWYELPKTENAVDAFTRLNVGKIPLTDAELVRALFLRSRNFPQVTATVEQLRIAQEWDGMEKALQNDDFWYFLTHDPNRACRIELVFDLMAEEAGTDMPFDGDSHSCFYYFDDLLAEEAAKPTRVWDDVKQLFMSLEEWHRDQDLFHLVGYLVHEGASVLELVRLSRGKGRIAFRAALKERIWKQLLDTDLHELDTEAVKEDLAERVESLRYSSRDAPAIRSFLLLFNIAAIIESEKSIVRFRFDCFKKETWDIEHIRSVESRRPTANIEKLPWLQVVCRYFEATTEHDDLLKRAGKMKDERTYTKGDLFDQLYDEIVARFGEHVPTEAEHGIGNLALLDSRTNRGYKNAVFPVKRKWLVDMDQAGTFVPPCTRNAFLKCYSQKVGDMLSWTEKDQADYRDAMTGTLTTFFAGNREAAE